VVFLGFRVAVSPQPSFTLPPFIVGDQPLLQALGESHGFSYEVSNRCRFRFAIAHVLRAVRRYWFGADFCWQKSSLGLGTKFLVSLRPSNRYWIRRDSVMVWCYLSAHHSGNDAALKCRYGYLSGRIYIALVGESFVLSGSRLGIRTLLYDFWCPGYCQLVLGATTAVPLIKEV
jgi:hypothetical protein